MLFLTYWKISEEISVRQMNEIAMRITEGGTLEPEDAEIVRWDATPDRWGVTIWRADDYTAVQDGINMWRAAAGETAFFEETKTAPAAPAEDAIQDTEAMLQKLE